MGSGIKRGILQSRGLGDIVIALPIARWYYEQGDEIFWPICEEFLPSFEESVPWITWIGVETDKEGRFFLETPLRDLTRLGVKEADLLYLYQYLNARPDLTNLDYWHMMKFDQYKYAMARVPFREKWRLDRCITRDPVREKALLDQLGIRAGDRYMLYQGRASDIAYNLDLSSIDPAVRKIEITALTDVIFDWLGAIEGAESLVLIDSVFANLIDQLGLCKNSQLTYVRKWNRTVDGNPVLLGDWKYLPVGQPAGTEPPGARVDPAVETQKMRAVMSQAAAARAAPSGLTSHVPFAVNKKGYPTSFLDAVKKPQQGGQPKMSSALDLYKQLGVKY